MLTHNCGTSKTITGKRKNLLIIGGGILQYQTIIQASELKLGKILVDGNPDCYCRKSPYFNDDYFIHCSTKDIKGIINKVKQFLKKHRVKIVGVYTQGCDVEYTVACVAKALGLPGIKPESAFACNNKIEMHQRFSEADIPQAKYAVVDNLKQARDKANELGYPCVIKSVDNCGSRGLTVVNSDLQVNTAFFIAQEYSQDKRVLLEEFLEGNEYSVDTIIYKGKLYPAGISDREFIQKDNYAIQTGSLTPSLLPGITQSGMYWIMKLAARALGVDKGAFKGDLIIHNGAIKVLEVTARLSGGFDSQYRKPYSFGVNLIKATMDIAMGKKLDFSDIIPQWFKYSKTFSLFPKPGIVKEIRGLKEAESIPGVMHIFFMVKEGDKIDYKHCADRVVHIVIMGNTLQELRDTQNKVLSTLRIITK